VAVRTHRRGERVRSCKPVVGRGPGAASPSGVGTRAADDGAKLQDLVDRGLIPRQALEPAPLTIDENLRDLANRGLIPRPALEEAPVTIIFGPAHPLGAPDIGIPCSELVYTRC
jgi:hypothetical protein